MEWKDSIQKFLDLIQWLVGVTCLMAVFGAVREAPFFALGSFVLGLWLLPPVRRYVLKKLPEKTGKWAKWLVPIGAFILLAGNTPEPEPTVEGVPEGLESLVEEAVPAEGEVEEGGGGEVEPSEAAEAGERGDITPANTPAVEEVSAAESTPAEPESVVVNLKPENATELMVTRVTDGDTFDMENGETVRLIGINAPERGQPFYEEASALLRDLVEDRTVRLEQDVSERDRYERLLAYVYAGDTFVNRELVAAGLAKSYAYEPDTSRQGELDAAQAEAQAAGRGMWQALESESSAGSAGSFAIAAFAYDSPGNDNETLDQESVTLRNTGTEAVALGGYALSDEANHVYTFPAFSLASGATVTIVTGSGSDTGTTLYWGLDGAVWNNGGDTLYLANSVGDIIFTHSY